MRSLLLSIIWAVSVGAAPFGTVMYGAEIINPVSVSQFQCLYDLNQCPFMGAFMSEALPYFIRVGKLDGSIDQVGIANLINSKLSKEKMASLRGRSKNDERPRRDAPLDRDLTIDFLAYFLALNTGFFYGVTFPFFVPNLSLNVTEQVLVFVENYEKLGPKRGTSFGG